MYRVKDYKYKGKGIVEPKISLKDLILLRLSENGGLTREELSIITGIPKTTLYANLVKLIMDGKVRKRPLPRKVKGRPKILFELNTFAGI